MKYKLYNKLADSSGCFVVSSTLFRELAVDLRKYHFTLHQEDNPNVKFCPTI